MAKELAKYAISHNDIGEIDRGVWRKYNPYNPYVENKEENDKKDLKVDSLDDLFEDDKKEDPSEDKNDIKVENTETNDSSKLPVDVKDTDAPILPMDEEPASKEKEEYDLQKELEAKFDELFGPIDDDNN